MRHGIDKGKGSHHDAEKEEYEDGIVAAKKAHERRFDSWLFLEEQYLEGDLCVLDQEERRHQKDDQRERKLVVHEHRLDL